MDFYDDYGIDPMEALFLSELLDQHHQQDRQTNTTNNQQQQHNQILSKEGKLIIHIDNIQGLLSSSSNTSSSTSFWMFGISYECHIILDDYKYQFIIPIESINNPNYIFNDYIFDIFEYYGGMKLKILLIQKYFYNQTIILGEIEYYLHDLINEQEKYENCNIPYISLLTIRDQHQVLLQQQQSQQQQSQNTLKTFWGYSKQINIIKNDTQHHQHQHHISINLSTRFISIQKCMKTSFNRRYYNPYKSELHHICLTGSAQIITNIIEILARKNLLKLTLNCRESPDGRHGYNCLELALIARNLPVIKVLLQRAGNLCFGGINSMSSLLPDILLNSPYQHLGILHTFLDLSQLLRPSNSGKYPTMSNTNSIPSFTPHTSSMDKSFFTQISTSNTTIESSNSTTNSVFQIDQTLKPNEIMLYTGGSPIHIAILGGSDCLQLILNFLTKYSHVVTGWEGVSSLADMLEYTANRYDDITPFMLACLLGDDKSAKLLFDIKKTSSIPPLSSSSSIISLKYSSKQTGYTPLMLACYSGNYEIVKLLLNSIELVENQIPIAADGLNTARIANSSSRKVLEKYFQQESLVSLISCIPLAKDYQGRQAISIAAMCGNANILQLLIQRGISYNTSDINGMTPLHYGAYYGHKTVCDVIIQHEFKLISRYESIQTHQNHKNKYILKSFLSSNNENSTDPTSSVSVSTSNSTIENGEYYSYQILTNKTQLTTPSPTPISSLNYMTRRPNALLRMDLFGNRPADIAIRRCYPEITIRLHIAVLEIYGINHPPTYSNIVNSEPLVLDLIEEKNNTTMDLTSQQQQGKVGYHPLPTEKNGGTTTTSTSTPTIQTKLSSMIPLPFHFLPLKNSTQYDKSEPTSLSSSITSSSNVPPPPSLASPTTPQNELDLVTLDDEIIWTNEDEWALNAAYNFATTLTFPTPPPSPNAHQFKHTTKEDGGDDDEDDIKSGE